MKQVLNRRGQIVIEEVPTPTISNNMVLVKTAYSLISTGTEISSVSGAGTGLARLIMKNPNMVTQGIKSVKDKGLKKTFDLATGKTNIGAPLGYSAAGVVEEVGTNITGFKIGDRVACAGGGFASHAEFLTVPKNLLVKIPDNISLQDAASVTVGAIALQGFRRANPKLGETVAVIGLGLLGQITVQLLKAAGCKVIGIDIDESRISLAKEFSAEYGFVPTDENIIESISTITNGYGVDATIITAASKSDEPLNQSMFITRKKGTVVIVGDIGLHLERSQFYQKEIDLKISTSYGPGRYDDNYETKGADYPFAYVRWTENRNMQAYLSAIADGDIQLKKIISKEFAIDNAAQAYQQLKSPDRPYSLLLRYNAETAAHKSSRQVYTVPRKISKDGLVHVGLIGAGGFATTMHLPNLQKLSKMYSIHAIANRNGLKAKQASSEFNATYATSDYHDLLKDDEIDLVIVTTRHNSHAQLAIDALNAGKAVLIEKPMALDEDELKKVVVTIKKTGLPYMIGFNRRFSPFAKRIKESVNGRVNPLMIYYRMNAGYLPPDHWTQGPEGGGRIIGEACHIIDLFNFWTESFIKDISVTSLDPKTKNTSNNDNVVCTIKYNDGSVCNLIYTSVGSKNLAKEHCEIFFDGKSIVMDDYESINFYGISLKSIQLKIPDKGHLQELIELHETLTGINTKLPIQIDDMIQTTKATFTINNNLKKE